MSRGSIPHPSEDRVLARLLQIRGDIEEAKKLAESAGDEWLLYDLQFRTGDWDSLARNKYHQRSDNLEDCGFRAAYHRLAGNQTEFEQAVTALRNIARAKPDDARWCGRNLMINGRWDDARELFATSNRWKMFELDRSRLEFSRAFRSIGILEPRASAARSFIENKLGKLLFGIAIATTLHELGEPQEATRLLERLETVAPEYPGFGEGPLLKAQLALGHRELANRFASVHVADDKVVLRILFGLLQEEDRVYVAHEWWSYLRSAKAHESHATTLASVLHILRAGPGDASKADIVALIDGARTASAQLPLERRYYRLNAIAEACAIWGENDRARAIWSEQLALAPDLKPNGSTYYPPRTLGPLLRIADLWAREGRWDQAAATYHRGWEAHQDYEVALYLCGHAFVKAGREAEGRKLMEQAIILPLANVERREKLVETMQKIGLRDEALAQCEIVLRVGPYEEWEGSRAWAVAHAVEIVAEHVAPSNPLAAAELWQHRLFYLLKTSGDAGEYVDAVHQFHKARALGLLAGDRLDDATKEIRLAQAAKLGDVELVEKSFVKFAAAGKTENAQHLFDENYAAYESVVRDFPRSAVHHNGLARLAAHCGRKLDTALTHAQEAVRLMPQRPEYLDTLAEVHFRCGDYDEAIAWETKAAQHDPNNAHFQEQLRRFRNAK